MDIAQHPWLAPVPADWRVARLKTTVAFSQNGLWGEEPDGVNDIVCVRVADFDRIRRKVILDAPTTRSIPATKIGRRFLKRGDLLIEKSGGGEHQPVGTVVKYDHDTRAVCSNFVARIEPKSGFDPDFLCYLHAALYELRVPHRSIKQTTGIQNLDAESYFNEPVPLPPIAIQQRLANFLGRKTAAIDDLIAKKEHLVELLQERRQAVITQAVTKGLDPNVPMKESGSEWIGSIPAHWDVARVKHVARLESGHTPSRSVPEHWLDSNDIPWVSLNDTKTLAKNDYISDTTLCINELGLQNSSARMLPARVVVFTRDATIGKAAITTRPMAVSQHIIAWVCGRGIDPEYLLRVFYGMEKFLDRFTFGATIKTIGMDDVGELVTPVPPREEQTRIVDHVRESVGRIDNVLEKVEVQITKLIEYRQALITAAVTGQLDIEAV